MNSIKPAAQSPNAENRANRRPIAIPGRVTWKDSRGATRFASVVTRDISESGVYIEWQESSAIPLYRLVSLQIERVGRNLDALPAALRSGKVLSAVYRTGSIRRSTGTPDGYGLRMLIEPTRKAVEAAEPFQTSAIA